MKTKIAIVILILISLVIVSTTWAAIITTMPRTREKTMRTSGVIAIGDFGIYWNNVFTNRTTEINWGVIDVGGNKSVTLYIRHEGTVPFQLRYRTLNWNPSNASDFLTLKWNYNDKMLALDEVITVTLTLEVSNMTSGIINFSFDITVYSV